jgi:DNA-binding NarL/FixJ family response regulator
MLKILIADDHIIVRRGIMQILLEGFPELEIGEAADTTSLVEKAVSENWDLIISDISMPGGGGLIALKKIRELKPGQPVLIVTIFPEEQYALPVFRAGASGFLNKDTAAEELLIAVKKILAGHRYLPASLAEKLKPEQCREAGILPHELLSETGLEIMYRYADGQRTEDMAEQMQLATVEVSNSILQIMDKLALSTRQELVQYIQDNQLNTKKIFQ